MADAIITAPNVEPKVCSCCKEPKPRTDFYSDKKTKDGLYSRCKPCHLATTNKWAKENNAAIAKAARIRRKNDPEKHRAYQREFQAKLYAKNPEKFKLLSKKNRAKDPEKTNATSAAARAKKPEQTVAYQSEYYELHKDAIKKGVKERYERLKVEMRPAICERVMRRNARKKQAAPSWANIEAMQAIYKLAAEITKATGIKHHVDHCVPLQSKKVCGLHVENNLQILTASENQTKGNRWWPDCP